MEFGSFYGKDDGECSGVSFVEISEIFDVGPFDGSIIILSVDLSEMCPWVFFNGTSCPSHGTVVINKNTFLYIFFFRT